MPCSIAICLIHLSDLMDMFVVAALGLSVKAVDLLQDLRIAIAVDVRIRDFIELQVGDIHHAVEIAIRAGMPLKIAAKVDRADREYFKEEIRALLDHPLIEFIGEIGNCEKASFLGNAAALLFPIEWPEPFGLVMIESMACGTPVIAYPCGSVPEIILDGVTGFVVPDVASAVAAVERIDQIDRRVCREHFELNFSSERMAKDYVNIYQQLVHRRSASMTVEEGVLNWMEVGSQTPSTT
jgi:glycosyltransferase involved in cell wall biosynthesis